MIALALISILAGPADSTLRIFQQQTQLQTMWAYDDLIDIRTNAVDADDPHEALEQMLEGTRLVAMWGAEDSVTIVLRPPPFRSDGWDYACVPALWVAGMVYNRLGLLLLDLGEIPRETRYCTPEHPTFTPRPAGPESVEPAAPQPLDPIAPVTHIELAEAPGADAR